MKTLKAYNTNSLLLGRGFRARVHCKAGHSVVGSKFAQKLQDLMFGASVCIYKK